MKLFATTPDREDITSMVVHDGHLFVSTRSHLYRLVKNRRGVRRLVPVKFEAPAPPIEEPAFKRLHVLPRRYYRYAVRGGLLEQLRDESDRQRYIREQSQARHARRSDAYQWYGAIPNEIGSFESFRFITSAKQ